MDFKSLSLPELETRKAELLADDDSSVEDLTSVAEELRVRYELKSQQDAARAALSGLAGRSEPEAETRMDAEPLDRRAVAESFVQSDAIDRIRENSGSPFGAYRQEFPTIETRALITTTEAGVSQATRIPGVLAKQNRTLRLVDLIDTVAVSTNNVEDVRETTTTPQGSPAVVAEGGVKPESTYTWNVISVPMKTVAHWTKASRQVLDDETQLQSTISGRLFYGLGYYLDAQILNGTGASSTMTGILNTTGVGAYDIGATDPSQTESKVISVRRAMTQTQIAEYQPDTLIINPLDWETIELSRDDTGRWRVTENAQGLLNPRLWGLNVVATTAIPAGKFVVGDFTQAVTLYDRQRATLAITDSDGTDFQKNIVTLRAELRANIAVRRPDAVCVGTFRGSE